MTRNGDRVLTPPRPPLKLRKPEKADLSQQIVCRYGAASRCPEQPDPIRSRAAFHLAWRLQARGSKMATREASSHHPDYARLTAYLQERQEQRVSLTFTHLEQEI